MFLNDHPQQCQFNLPLIDISSKEILLESNILTLQATTDRDLKGFQLPKAFIGVM